MRLRTVYQNNYLQRHIRKNSLLRVFAKGNSGCAILFPRDDGHTDLEFLDFHEDAMSEP